MRNNTIKVLVPLAVLVTVLAFQSSALLPPAFAASTWYVAPSPAGTGNPGGSCSAPGFNTISAAIAAASAGDTINVCTGTYTEQVTIPTSLTLTGVPYPHHSSLAPTIQAPTILTVGSPNIVTIESLSSQITVTFQGFTVTGPGQGGCDSLNTGISVEYGVTAYILQNTIEHIRDQPLSGCVNGQGIFVSSNEPRTSTVPSGAITDATITDNTISDYQKAGIVVVGQGSMATITGNTVTGVGPSTVTVQDGIVVRGGAVATIKFNTVSGNECNSTPTPQCGPDLINDEDSVGIALICAPTLQDSTPATTPELTRSCAALAVASGTVGSAARGSGTVVTVNTVSGNDVGIGVYQDSGVTIDHNKVINNRYAGIALEDGTYTASFNRVTGPGVVGIVAIATSLDTSVTLSGNDIDHVTVSIEADAESGLTATILFS